MTHEIRFDAERNVATLGGESMVFHCHFYNCTLQRAVETIQGEARAREVLRAAAVPSVKSQLAKAVPPGASPSEVLAHAASIFCELGFGRFAPIALDGARGEVILSSSHYAMGWLSIYGERKTPACSFVEGFLQGALEAAFSRPARVVESRCFASGHDDCRFDVEVQR